jgi:hypothetical protein
MLSGEPLITDEQFAKLLANYLFDWRALRDTVPVVKIFLPHIRWLLVWIYPHDHDLAVAIYKRGNDRPQLGNVQLSDIVRSRLGPLMPERDKYITLDQPISHYLLHDTSW